MLEYKAAELRKLEKELVQVMEEVCGSLGTCL